MDRETRRLAVLIDAENAQLAVLADLLAEIAKLGLATVKRVYGDFTSPLLASWREPLLAHSIQPIQQFRNTVHKNASDSALIIDAMDLLHSAKFDGFCIVSSDSDFTRLASRIREEGILVYGYGEQKTPKSFIAACDKIIYTEILTAPTCVRTTPTKPPTGPSSLNDLAPRLTDAVESCADEAGWSFLGTVGNLLANHIPDFDPRHFGFGKLSTLIEAVGLFEIERRGNDQMPQLFVRMKPDAGNEIRAHECVDSRQTS